MSDFSRMTITKLRQRAKLLRIVGRSRLRNRQQLIDAISSVQEAQRPTPLILPTKTLCEQKLRPASLMLPIEPLYEQNYEHSMCGSPRRTLCNQGLCPGGNGHSMCGSPRRTLYERGVRPNLRRSSPVSPTISVSPPVEYETLFNIHDPV